MTFKKLALTLAMGLMATGLSSTAFAGAIDANGYSAPRYTSTSVRALDTDKFQPIWFRAGEVGAIAITGDGSTSLDLYVYDANGNLIGHDEGTSPGITFQVYVTSGFTVYVHNRGSVYNDYVLRTN